MVGLRWHRPKVGPEVVAGNNALGRFFDQTAVFGGDFLPPTPQRNRALAFADLAGEGNLATCRPNSSVERIVHISALNMTDI